MTFLNPALAIIGVACVAIPILIHILMRRRRKPVAWGAMKFLLAAYKQQRRRTRLEQLLLLASRCLLVALVALAVGKPVLGSLTGNQASGPRTLYILLDNSLVSQATPLAGGAGELDVLKQRARRLLDELNPSRGDRAALVTLAGPADGVVLPPAMDVSRVGALVMGVEAQSSRADMSGALAMVRAAMERDRSEAERADATVVLLSSWRAGAANLAESVSALGAGEQRVRVRASAPASEAAPNVTIASVEPLRSVTVSGENAGPDAGSITLRVELRRSGESGSRTTRVRGWHGERAPAEADGVSQTVVTWNPGQASATAMLTLRVPTDTMRRDAMSSLVHVECDGDAIAGDNVFRRPLEVLPALRVAMLAPSLGAASDATIPLERFGGADWLALVLTPARNALGSLQGGSIVLEAFDPDRLTFPADPAQVVAELRDARVILVPRPASLSPRAWSAIAASCRRGALVMIMPSDEAQTHMWPDAMNQAFGLTWTIAREPQGSETGWSVSPAISPSPEEDLLALLRPELPDLVKPVRVTRLLRIESTGSPRTSLLSAEDGTPLIISARPGMGDGESGAGLVVLWLTAPALEWTSLPAKPLFVPLVQELIRQGVGAASPARTLVAGRTGIAPFGAVEMLRVGESSERVRVSDGRTPPVRRAGTWQARGADGATIALLGVNSDPDAGRTDPQSREQVERWLSGLSGDVTILGEESGTGAARSSSAGVQRDAPPISPLLLILAGLVALAEVVMARVFSHARTEAVPA